MLKNESAQNSMKPTPLCPARLPDSGGIIFMSNGVRMEKISHSVRRAKQAKIWMLTVPVRTGHVSVRTADVACPYADTWQVPYMTHGGSRECHVSGRFGTFGMQLGQSQSDTCHHWKGDTWQGDVSS